MQLLSLLHFVTRSREKQYWLQALSRPNSKKYYERFADPNKWFSDEIIDRYILLRGLDLLPLEIFLVPASEVGPWMSDMEKMNLLRGRMDRKNLAPLVLTEPLTNKNVFLLPFHQKGSDHWKLYVYVKTKRRMYMMNSLRAKSDVTPNDEKEAAQIFAIVAKLFAVQGTPLDPTEMFQGLEILDVPLQEDTDSCGVFICLFADFVMQHPTDFMNQIKLLETFIKSETIFKHRINIANLAQKGLPDDDIAPVAADDDDDDDVVLIS